MALRIIKCKDIAEIKMPKKRGNPVYDLNRPVHLARCGTFIEKSRELFEECIGKTPPKRRLQCIDATLYYLHSALEHATLAAKSTRTNPLEDSFLAFIRMLASGIYSARFLLDIELQLADDKSPLWQFLHRRGKVKQTVRFARTGQQLLEDAEHLFQVSGEPFEELHQTLLESMSAEERARYQLAREGLRGHLANSPRIPRGERFFQTFLQAP